MNALFALIQEYASLDISILINLFPTMEENYLSLHICDQLINECIMPNVYQSFFPDNAAIATYSLHKSTAVTQSLVVADQYCPDRPRNTLAEDPQLTINFKKNIRIGQAYKQPIQPKVSMMSRQSMQTRTRDEQTMSMSSFAPPKLVPLQHFQEFEDNLEESQDLQSRLRERKFHQQYFRSRFQQNFKQGTTIKKKQVFMSKNQGKGHNIIAYDFDGGIIEGNCLRQEGVKLPTHYLDLQAHIVEEQNKEVKKKLSKIKQLKQQTAIRREDLKVAESHFLKDFHLIHWIDGVEPSYQKQECRQILGYQNPNAAKKKTIDLFKQTDKPIRVKFQDLNSYKNLVSSNSQLYLSHEQNVPTKMSEKSIIGLSSKNFRIDNRPKQIKITNNKALQFLIDSQNEVQIKTRSSVFKLQEKKIGKSLHVH